MLAGEANHRTLMELLRDIEKEGNVDVVVSPECSLDGLVVKKPMVTTKNIGQYAVDPESSPYVRAIAQWCKRNGTWFIYGCSRRDRERVYNSALIIDRFGGFVGSFDKLHVGAIYAPGSRLGVYDSDFGPFGVMICADRRWPETVRTLALKGARVIFNPSYGSHRNFNRMMMRTRSYESEVFIVFTLHFSRLKW